MKNIINRLNELRLFRREIAEEEAELFILLRNEVPGAEAEPVRPIEVVSSIDTEVAEARREVEPNTEETAGVAIKQEADSESNQEANNQGSAVIEEEWAPEPREPTLGVFRGAERLVPGARVYITNKIFHHKEKGRTSNYHRLATVTEHASNGRVIFNTDSGHSLWRKKKNLSPVIQE